MTWRIISDNKVRHVWQNADGEEVTVNPDFYEENGEPSDGEAGEVMTYIRTEIQEE